MSSESTFIPLAFEWDREAQTYTEAFRLTPEEIKKAAELTWAARKADPKVNAHDAILDAIVDGRLSANFAACMIELGAQKWWDEVGVGVCALLGEIDEDETE